MRVLVVDDECAVRRSCERILEEEGLEVACVTRGEESLLIIADGEIDIVILDMMMPGVGGMETLRHIRGRWPDLPVVAISGYATLDIKRKCRELGASAWLEKPFGPDELLAALTEASQ